MKFSLTATLICLGLGSGLLVWNLPLSVAAQDAPNSPAKKNPPEPASAPAPGTVVKADIPATPKPKEGSPEAPAVQTPVKTQPLGESENVSASDEIQLSFQGANIDMVVQWLAKTTGKSVVKHPKVQCQLTIVSSKKLTARDAISLVYRALSLEGFTTVETSNSILLLPEGQEPKTSPELIGTSQTELPSGRQRLIKIFPLKNIQAAELREKIRTVLSDKSTIEVSERSNQIIVTDYTDNIRLLGELIKELDVVSGSDSVVEFFSLKFSEAEELGNLLSLILNAQPAPPSSPSRSSSSPSSSRSSSPFPGGPSSGSMEMSSSSPPPPSGSSSSSGGGSAGGATSVKIWPDKVSNRLIVAAQRSKLPEIKKLIELLDTEKPQDVSIRVLPLRNVSAEDMVRDLAPLYQKMSGKSIKDTIEVAANSRANSLVVLSSEYNFKAIEKLIASLDTEEAQEKTMRAFPLKNAEAEDVAKQLQDLNQDQDSSSRYPYFFFSSGMNNKSSKKSNFVADRRRNTVIVQAPPAAMDNIEKMIKALDEPVNDDSLAPKIFRLKYVSATDIEDVLNELFLKKQNQRAYWDPYGFPGRDSGDSQSSGGKLYGKIRITSEAYANAIIVTSNSRENLAAVEEVIKDLDVPSQAGETTLRVGLRFAKASTVANSINILFAKNGSPPLRGVPQQNGQPNPAQPQQQQNSTFQSNFALEQESKEEGYFPWLGGQQDNLRGADGRNANRPVSDLVGRVRVVADQRSNALLISANVHFFPQVIKLIEDLDAPTAQVLIEAKIVEVGTDFLDKLGVRWSPDGTKTFTADDYDNSILGRANSDYKKGFGGNTTVNTPSGAGGLAQALASLRSGVLDSSVSMDFLVQFLRKTTEATVLAEPQINIADNELGKLFVGQQVPIPDNTQISQLGGQNTSIKYKEVGVILEVTPHINSSGDIALKIRAESSTIVPGQIVLGGAVFDTRNFKTDLTAKNGQTLVLGGIIQRQVSDTLRKTPFFGNIPGLGWAFKKRDKSTREVELMVFLRPKVVRSPEEARELLEEMDRKAPLIKKWRNGAPLNQEKEKEKDKKPEPSEK